MDDLVQFLRARLDEDERAARHADSGPWVAEVGYISGGSSGAVRVAQQAQAWNAGHIVRHDPARVLAEVDAKRRIVDHLEYELADHGSDNPWWYDDKLLPILHLLALLYADHPDYRDEWRP